MTHPALAILEAQRAAWNRADLEGYLAYCAEDIVYLSVRGPVFGRQALRESMRAAYPDPAAMGSLSLSVFHSDEGPRELRAVLRWEVRRVEGEPVGGYALVILQEREGRWWLRHDATLSVPTRPGDSAPEVG